MSFEVSKAEQLNDAARKEAVANALRRAKLLATAAGAEVGEVISITEEAMQFAPRGPMLTRAAAPGSVPDRERLADAGSTRDRDLGFEIRPVK